MSAIVSVNMIWLNVNILLLLVISIVRDNMMFIVD